MARGRGRVAGADLSVREARWLAIEAQGLGRSRPAGRAAPRHLQRAIDAMGTIQVDAINVLARTQFLVLFSRLGDYDVGHLHALTAPPRPPRLFEYWGHAASLLPVEHQPLFRWRMEVAGPYGHTEQYARKIEAWRADHADYIAAVLAEVRDRGPLSAGQLTDPRPRDGEWWDRRSVGRQALEWLFFRGEVMAWRTPNFERVYDLPERVLPPAVQAAPTPSVEEAHRQLLLLSARSLGVATVRDLADYYRLRPSQARVHVAELVEAGALESVSVEGWTEAGYVVPDTVARRPTRRHATLLSPFDPLVWERARTSRMFGFDYRIEVYTPEPKRIYGYYVLPLLLGDELVGRFDLKADRQVSALRVSAAHREDATDAATVAEAAAVELDWLRDWLGLDRIEVGRRGNLATALRGAVRAVA